MRAKVRRVKRSVWYEESQTDHWRSDVHPVRYTNTYCIATRKGEKYYVDLDEDDIKEFYDRSRITHALIDELNDDLCGVIIDFYEDEDGDYCLDGCLADYIGSDD